MRHRSVSSIGVVLVGLLPAIAGGVAFALVFTVLMVVGFLELARMLRLESPTSRWMGCALIAFAGLLAFWTSDNSGLPVLVAACVFLPLTLAVFSRGASALSEWPPTVAATLYLALPAFAAVSIRQQAGTSGRWLEHLDAVGGPGSSGTSLGLGWLLLVLFTTWLSDTGAYLVGKNLGRRKLIPRISPNKTVEGAAGGIGFAALTSLLCSWMFQLDLDPVLALLLGSALGVVGILGDLGESAIKRHAGVKDSGALIPGHGGMLDRIDALLLTLVATWLLIPILA